MSNHSFISALGSDKMESVKYRPIHASLHWNTERHSLSNLTYDDDDEGIPLTKPNNEISQFEITQMQLGIHQRHLLLRLSNRAVATQKRNFRPRI